MSVQHFGIARDLGMETVGFLMMAHRTTPAELARQARIMADAGAQCVYCGFGRGADAGERASGSRPSSTRSAPMRRWVTTATRTWRSAWLTPCWPTRTVRCRSTGRCAAWARPGNSPTEVLAATFDRMGIVTGVDVHATLAAADEVVKPYLPRLPWTDRASIVQGYAGVYSSFLLHAEHAAERYGVPVHDILERVAEHGYVGGQEDMLIDVALQLAREQEAAGSPA